MDLVNIISSLTGNDVVNEIGKKFDVDSNKVSSVITSALPTLIGAMQKNASTESGAASLAKALGDHAGNAGSLLGNLQNVDLVDGGKILSKILGNNASSIFDQLGKQTGTTSGQVSNILAAIAPSLLNILGNLKGSNNGNALGSILGTVLAGAASGNSSNKGGSILGSVLGGLFGKK